MPQDPVIVGRQLIARVFCVQCEQMILYNNGNNVPPGRVVFGNTILAVVPMFS